jgi:phosphoribosylformimino-5-aminoimidazole carboxamide ribotide isomerase
MNPEFRLYPAIDIRDGKAVRLFKGDYEQMTVYHEHPPEVARAWEAQGAQFLHVVDLDGAKNGVRSNQHVIRQIVEAVNIPVQVGGGIRDMQTLESYLELGVARCILGTAAVQNPGFVKDALNLYGDKIVIGLDAKDGKVAVNGWLETSDITAVELGKQLARHGATRVIFTDIARDGTLNGPNVPAIVQLAQETGLKVIASGGVKSVDDLVELAGYAHHGVAGAIIGKALYTGAIRLSEAIQAVAVRED